MKIALLHYSSPPIVGGVESVLAHHARMMANAGHQVTILAGRGKAYDGRIPVHILPRLDSRYHEVSAVKNQLDVGEVTADFDRLKNGIQSELMDELMGMDILIAHNVASLHKNLALSAAIHDASQQSGFPRLILWHHDLAWTTARYRHDMHEGYPWNLLKTPWKNARQVVVSELRRQELSTLFGIKLEEITVVPNGVDLNTFYKLEEHTIQLVEQLKLIQPDPLFLLPVRLTPRKNIELALKIMAKLRNFYPKSILLVTGPEGPHNPSNATYKARLISLRNGLNLQGVVHFLAEITTDFLPDAVIADFYRLGDALLFPSQEEGFGIPVIEAAFSSMPVFCADIPVLRELAGDDVSYFHPDGDPETIARQIWQKMESETTSRWARTAKCTYTWESIYVQYIEPIIKEVSL
jgi:glycosyltransferase involved in cell wall biosynthesis